MLDPISLIITLSKQTLTLWESQEKLRTFPVSTSMKGSGEQKNSEQTPRGKHIVRAKIGDRAPINTVFVGRRPTGEIYNNQLAEVYSNRDWILTRIFWLSGTEINKNRLGNVDSMQRYIYIHGTPDSEPMKVPASHGCIRMRNTDIIELFNLVPIGCIVTIIE